jgi:RNA polymerase sigma-70 factor (ECF subfamily)
MVTLKDIMKSLENTSSRYIGLSGKLFRTMMKLMILPKEVFIKVYSALKNFREESNLFTWLYRIATNFAKSH